MYFIQLCNHKILLQVPEMYFSLNWFQNYDISKVLRIMETMISVSSHEFAATLKTGQSQAQIEPLLQLVSALQTSLLSWCWAQIIPEEEESKKDAHNVWRENALQLITKCRELFIRQLEKISKEIFNAMKIEVVWSKHSNYFTML